MKKIIALLTALLFCSPAFSQSIERIEPANWWTGMKYNTLTLLVYGRNIAHLSASLDYPEVDLLKTEKTENKNYLFVTLRIRPGAQPGTVKLRFNENGNTVLSRDFPLLKREDGSADRKSFSQKDAICLLFPDRFSNGDPRNDIIQGMNETGIDRNDEDKRHGGDLQGIINHLDYLKDLGYTQLWPTPLTENNEPRYSYHGYAATDFYKIDPRFGTNEQFKQLVQEARKRGIGVIWDAVLNHCGDQYYFIKDLPSGDWTNFTGIRTRSNHEKSTILDIYATEIDKREYLNGWFDDHMADLNQRNPLMARFLIQNTLWWIEYAGLSGLRVDTFSYSDKDFLADWARTVLEEYPQMNIVGEEMTNNIAYIAYWQKDKVNTDGYRSYLPSLMDFSLNHFIIQSLTRSGGYFSSWREMYQSIAQDYHFPHPYNQLIFPDNHDLDRFYTRLNKDPEHWKLGIALYMTMRGIPQFFYGTEVLMTNEKQGSDGQRRGDFYGGWAEDTKNARTGKGLSEDEKEAQKYFSRLLNWRKNNPAVSGGFKHYAPQRNDVYVYFRYQNEHKVMVVLNKNPEAVSLDMARYTEMVPASFEATDIVSGRNIRVENRLTVPGKKAMILEIR